MPCFPVKIGLLGLCMAAGVTWSSQPASYSRHSLDARQLGPDEQRLNVDINRDGKLDTLLYGTGVNGRRLQVYLSQSDGRLIAVYDGTNFSVDGGDVLYQAEFDAQQQTIKLNYGNTSAANYSRTLILSYRQHQLVADAVQYEDSDTMDPDGQTDHCRFPIRARLTPSLSIPALPFDHARRPPDCQVTYEIEDTLAAVVERAKTQSGQLDGIGRYAALMQRYSLTHHSLYQYNNLAFYLTEDGQYDEAVYLLNHIIQFNPQRTVAYLNLADAYWQLNRTVLAKKHYQTYVAMMKHRGLSHQIPSRVQTRIVSSAQ